MSSNPQNEEAINTHGDDNLPQGMLSSPHIDYCIKKYGIIEGHKQKCLRAATYDMRIGGKVLIWSNGKKKEIDLVEEKEVDTINSKLKYIELEPNSLTFVTTIEKFNLPKDIIARFNLKSKWVHKGLLLGTGPIVDPELNARLLIPIHNFSNKNVILEHGQELISVEFTKTLNPDDKIPLNEEECKYVPNRSKFDFDEYLQRISDKQIESSVLSVLNEHNKMFEGYRSLLKWYSWGGLFAIVTIIIGIAALITASLDLWATSVSTSTHAANVVKEHKEQNIDYSIFALNSDTQKNEERISYIKETLTALEKNYSLTSLPSISSELSILRKRVSELERKQEQPPVQTNQ